MKEINERIATLRKTLNLSMEKFGDKIGINRSSVNAIEKGRNNPSEQTLKLICNVFNVDYFWLTEGTGEMFTGFPETIIDEVVDEFNLNPTDKTILMAYLELPEEKREVVRDFLLTLAKKTEKGEN